MATHNFSSAYPDSQFEMDPIVRLAISVSSRLAKAQGAELVPAILDALDHIADATSVDACQLIELSSTGVVTETFGSAKSTTTPAVHQVSVLEDWLRERLSQGEAVMTSTADELPEEATQALEIARRTGGCSILALPAASGGEVVGGLVLHTSKTARRWERPLVEGLRMLAEIFGAALHRRRQELAMRANIETIEKLNARLVADNVYLKEEVKSYHNFDDIVGESPALRTALVRLDLVAQTNSSVLLIGPTGSGKELFARALHERSRRHTRPLVRVNCAALPPTLVESELFGHEKGAFTGAVGTRQGRFELADGGTLFLDEIGDLPPDLQVKFLRVLQEGEFERVGSSRTRRVDVRLIAATHQDLEAAVAEGRFRADLYYRLSVYPIRLPSLKERSEDIPQLVWFFINKHQRDLSRRITEIPSSVMEAFVRHDWPGNVRELENVVERSMIASKGEVLQLDAPLALTEPPRARTQGDALDDMQRAHIEAVLGRCGWKINGKGNAAERLGVHPNTLRFRLKKLNLNRPAAS